MEGDGHLVSLYVAEGCQRRGIGSLLLVHVIEHAKRQGIRRLHTEASKLSRPLFESFGFRLDRLDEAEYDGLFFTRALMSLEL